MAPSIPFDSLAVWFDGLQVTNDDQLGQTVIAGPVADQAALHGLLVKVRDLGLTLDKLGASNRTQAVARDLGRIS